MKQDNVFTKNIHSGGKSFKTAVLEVYAPNNWLLKCSHCERIRTFFGIWTEVPEALNEEIYDLKVSHGLCESCLDQQLELAKGDAPYFDTLESPSMMGFL